MVSLALDRGVRDATVPLTHGARFEGVFEDGYRLLHIFSIRGRLYRADFWRNELNADAYGNPFLLERREVRRPSDDDILETTDLRDPGRGEPMQFSFGPDGRVTSVYSSGRTFRPRGSFVGHLAQHAVEWPRTSPGTGTRASTYEHPDQGSAGTVERPVVVVKPSSIASLQQPAENVEGL